MTLPQINNASVGDHPKFWQLGWWHPIFSDSWSDDTLWWPWCLKIPSPKIDRFTTFRKRNIQHQSKHIYKTPSLFSTLVVCLTKSWKNTQTPSQILFKAKSLGPQITVQEVPKKNPWCTKLQNHPRVHLDLVSLVENQKNIQCQLSHEKQKLFVSTILVA